ncbi:MAG: FCD domain-containing protein [Betaproteobacteria bacterium]|nr:FCD domain-containing protein [Betaproteobacteria bacterium]MBI3936368.1 FCD domain-containing protein [Betaproteobacteria bacterium]
MDEKHAIEFRAANRRFHLLIAAATRNDLLHRLLFMIDDRIRVVGALHLDIRKDRAKEIIAENNAILAALRERDPARVTAVVLAHIRNSRAGLLPLGEASASPYPAPARNLPDAKKRRTAKKR